MKIADEIKVALVTAACIIAMAIQKNVLNLQLDFVSQYVPTLMFIAYILTSRQAKKVKHSAVYWSAAIVAVTAAILVIYSM